MMTEGVALSRDDARAYAAENGLVFLDGKEVMEAWREWSA
jgi:3,4-dihydroxy-2-butanone 4-phosphate synthase